MIMVKIIITIITIISIIYLFIFLFFKLFFIQLQFSVFSPHPSTPPQPVPPPSPTSTLPLDFVLVSFIVAPIDPSPHYPLPTSFWLVGSAGVGWRDGEKRHINII